jgi:AraC-like DNA-binding protein
MQDEPRGVLNLKAGTQKFQLTRLPPSVDLRPFIERYWSVRWDLRGQPPYTQETLPYPCVNLAIERGRSGIFGVDMGKFARQLEGQGWVFGIKFRPGAFYPFVRSPVAAFTNTITPIATVFGPDGAAFEAATLACDALEPMRTLAEDFLRARLPAEDANVTCINHIVEAIIADRTIIRVEDIAARFGFSTRTLQRLFRHYVGVSPKWVIRRYRLHEVAERLARGEIAAWPQIVLDLGYADQAHFIKDFKALVGCTPAEYARKIAAHLG